MTRKRLALLIPVAMIALGGGYVGYRKLAQPERKTYWLRDDILVHGNETLREVALTFDDGPRPEIVRPLLNVLGKYDARSTFFVVGKMVQQHPDIVRRMMNEGHEVANHSFNHPRLDGLSEDQIRTELAQCDKAVFQATGAHTNLFRPPGMRYDAEVIRAAQSLGYVTIHWKVAAQDFAAQTPEAIEAKVLDQVRPGSIVLLHNHPDTLASLPRILAELRRRGYRFVTVSQMLGRLPRPVYVKTNAYAAVQPVAIKKDSSETPRKSPRRTRLARQTGSQANKPTLRPAPHSQRAGIDVVADP